MVANNYTIEDVILLKEELSSNLSKYGSTLLNTIEYGLGGKKKMREYSEKGLLYIELLDKIINKNMSCGHKICTITTTKDGKTTSTRIIGKYGSKYKIKETTTINTTSIVIGISGGDVTFPFTITSYVKNGILISTSVYIESYDDLDNFMESLGFIKISASSYYKTSSDEYTLLNYSQEGREGINLIGFFTFSNTSTITITYKYIDIITSCISPCLYSKIKNYINSLNCNNC